MPGNYFDYLFKGPGSVRSNFFDRQAQNSKSEAGYYDAVSGAVDAYNNMASKTVGGNAGGGYSADGTPYATDTGNPYAGQMGGGGGGGSVIFPGALGGVDKKIRDMLLNAGQLPELDPSTLADLEKMRAAQLASAENVYGEQKDLLLEDLYGRGMQRSTVAGKTGAALMKNRAEVLAGIEGQMGAAKLQQRNLQAERQMQGALGLGDLNVRHQANAVQLSVGISQANAEFARTAAMERIALLEDATNRALGFGRLNLDAELGRGDLALRSRELDDKMYMFKKSRPSVLDKILGFAGALFGGSYSAY